MHSDRPLPTGNQTESSWRRQAAGHRVGSVCWVDEAVWNKNTCLIVEQASKTRMPARPAPGPENRDSAVANPHAACRMGILLWPAHGIGTARIRSATSLLNRRTRDVAVGTEHAAVAALGAKDGAAVPALVEDLAGVRRHRLGCAMLAMGTGQGGVKLHQRPGTRASQLFNRASGRAVR